MSTVTLLILCVCVLVVNMDITIINVAIGTIAQSLHATTSDIQWVTAIYTLAGAAAIIVTGSLSDRFGTRNVLAAGIGLFGVASALGAWAPSVGWVVLARAVMGLGSAAILTASLAFITKLGSEGEAKRALGYWSAAAALGLPLGPIVCGLLLDRYWWGSIFLINVVVCVAGLVVVVAVMPNIRAPQVRPVDWISVALLAASMSSFIFGLIYVGVPGSTAGAVIAICGSLVFGVVFGVRQKGSRTPLIAAERVKNWSFAGSITTLTILFLVMAVVLFTIPVFLQFGHELEVLDVGVRILPLAVFLAVAASTAGRVSSSVKPEWIAASGLAFALLGVSGLAVFGVGMPQFGLIAALAAIGLGVGLAQPTTLGSAMHAFPAGERGVAAGVINSARLSFNAIGVALVGVVTAVGMSWNLDVLPTAAGGAAQDSWVEQGSRSCSSTGDVAVCSAYTSSLSLLYAVCGVLLLLALGTLVGSMRSNRSAV
ncbi:MAG: MFS transporter [Sciscionella sp.]